MITYVGKSVEGEITVENPKTKAKKEKKVKVKSVVVPQQHATVGFSTSLTKNLGNYESVKINVSLYMPVDLPESTKVVEALGDMMQFCTLWVDQQMNQVLSELEPQKKEPQKTAKATELPF